MRGAPHVQASKDGCTECPKGAGRVPGGSQNPPTCSSSLCLRSLVADAPYKCLRHRFSVGRFLVGEGCATAASVRGRMRRTSKGCSSGPWGSGASTNMQQLPLPSPTCSSSLRLRSQVTDAPYKCVRHRFRVGRFLVSEGIATRASVRGGMQRTSKVCWSGPWGSQASADM